MDKGMLMLTVNGSGLMRCSSSKAPARWNKAKNKRQRSTNFYGAIVKPRFHRQECTASGWIVWKTISTLNRGQEGKLDQFDCTLAVKEGGLGTIVIQGIDIRRILRWRLSVETRGMREWIMTMYRSYYL